MTVVVQPIAVAECPVCQTLQFVEGGVLRWHYRREWRVAAPDLCCEGSGRIMQARDVRHYELATVARPPESAGG